MEKKIKKHSDRITRPKVLIVVRSIIIFKGKILLIQRSRKDSSDPLKWEIPGGKLDKGQDVKVSSERELVEEVGIFAIPLSPLFYVDSAIAMDKKYKGLPYIRIVGLYTCNLDKVRLSFEHDDFKWVTFDEALNMEITDITRKSLLVWEKEILIV